MNTIFLYTQFIFVMTNKGAMLYIPTTAIFIFFRFSPVPSSVTLPRCKSTMPPFSHPHVGCRDWMPDTSLLLYQLSHVTLSNPINALNAHPIRSVSVTTLVHIERLRGWRGRILVQVTIYRRHLVGHLDQSEAYDIL